MGRNRSNNVNDFLFGRNFSNSNDNNFVDSSGFNGNGNDVETVVSPTETVVNPTTNQRTVRRVHPTHVINVNRNITRVENYYPVKHSTENINSVEEYDCGSDLNNPCCRPVNKCNKKHY